MAKAVAKVFGIGKKKTAPAPTATPTADPAATEPETPEVEGEETDATGEKQKKRGRLALFATAGRQRGVLNEGETGRKRFLGA